MARTLRTVEDLAAAGLAEDTPALHDVARRYATALTPGVAALSTRYPAIARQYVPDAAELLTLPHELDDPTADAAFSPVKGVVHRYPDRALLKPLLACPVYCRFCFRREAVGPDGSGDAAALGARPGESWEDCFFRHLLDHVEPQLGRDRASFLTHWPAPQAALARRDPADPRVALRFELFAGGIELANAFEELTDAAEQRARLSHDLAERIRLHGEAWPFDADFIEAVAMMPPGSGIALGFDRLAMLASGARRIEDVMWLGRFPYEG